MRAVKECSPIEERTEAVGSWKECEAVRVLTCWRRGQDVKRKRTGEGHLLIEKGRGRTRDANSHSNARCHVL